MRALQFILLLLLLSAPAHGQPTENFSIVAQTWKTMRQRLDSGQAHAALMLGQPVLERWHNRVSPDDDDLVQLELETAYALSQEPNQLGAQQAEGILRSVLPHAASKNNPFVLRELFASLANIAQANGRLRQAFDYGNAALSYSRQCPMDGVGISLLNTIAGVASASGFHLRALNLLEEESKLLQNLPGDDARTTFFLVLDSIALEDWKVRDWAKYDKTVSQMQPLAKSASEQQALEMLRLNEQIHRSRDNGDFKQAIASSLELHMQNPAMRTDIADALGLESVGQLYFLSGDFEHTRDTYREVFAKLHHVIDAGQVASTDAERTEIAGQIYGPLSNFLSFCFLNRKQHPELLPEAYALVVWQKNILTGSTPTDQDPATTALRDNLQATRTQVAALGRKNQNDPLLAQLQTRVEQLQRQISASVRNASPSLTGAQIASAIDPRDAAVEIVTYTESDAFGPTFQTVYAAMMILPGQPHRFEMVRLGKANDIEQGEAYTTSRLRLRAAKPNQTALTLPTSLPWQAMEPALNAARRIFLSPAGVLNTTAFLAWKATDGRYLVDHDEWDLRPVFSTAGLIHARAHQVADTPRTAILLGDPDFGPQTASAATSPGVPLTMNVSAAPDVRAASGDSLPRLPFTAQEVDGIADILRRTGWSLPAPYEQAKASKAVLLEMHQPTVVHIATHGFFFPLGDTDEEISDAGRQLTLSNSGLLLANANLTLRGEQLPAGGDDGILSAFELEGLDLTHTELVVLSACETGLGQQAATGGLLGLRSAFAAAGSKAVLVSMWNVNDPATAELMKTFYETWQGSTHPDKYVALRTAVKAFRQSHPELSSFYWAPFVLYSHDGDSL